MVAELPQLLPGDGVTDSGSPSSALVLAGGGALGAFEAGVLVYALDVLGRDLGRQPSFNLFAGTSIGAINATFLAAHADDLAAGARALSGYWQALSFEHVARFGSKELSSLLRMVLGRTPGPAAIRPPQPRRLPVAHAPVAGLLDASPLYELIRRIVPWDRLQRNLGRGQVRGLALCATEICTGTSTIFYQTSAGNDYRPGRDPLKQALPAIIGLDHVMASAAMPFLFPSIQIKGVCYTDGVLRQNTPLNPVLRMGADRVLVISLTQEPKVEASLSRIGCRRNPYPGAMFLLGRTAKVLMTQTLDYELSRVEMYNRLIEGGCRVYGEGFLESFNQILGGYRNARYRPIRTCHLRPSQSLHQLALEALVRAPEELSLPGVGGKILNRLLNNTAIAESELLSLLMFTPTYIRSLLDLGYRDAKANREALLEFFGD